jgi:hypothetical protein
MNWTWRTALDKMEIMMSSESTNKIVTIFVLRTLYVDSNFTKAIFSQ